MSQKQITPWLSENTFECSNPNIAFHLEIIDFFKYIKCKTGNKLEKEVIFEKLRVILESKIQNSALLKIGSFATNLDLPSSSIDVVLIERKTPLKQLMKKIIEIVKQENEFEIVETYLKSKTPMIKISYVKNEQIIELVFNDESGILLASETNRIMKVYPEIPYLFVVLKLFLRQRKLNNSYTGGLGSFLLLSLIVHFVREYRGQCQWKYGAEESNEISLSQFLIRFLFYYSSEFSFKECQINFVGKIGVQRKNPPSNNLCVIFPLEVETDIGASCHKFFEITRIFKNRFNLLANTPMKLKGSILKHLINPNEQNFEVFEKF